MFENIPKKEKENMTIYVIIFGCLLTIANIIYLSFFHLRTNMGLSILAILFSSPFIFTIYKLIKALK